MGSIADRLSAFGRGAAQGATGGFVDELYPKILDAIPREDDNTGIPREYAGGSAEDQYKKEYRADDADAAQKYPLNYGAGAVAGAAPATVATSGGIMGSSLGAGAKLATLGLAGGAEGAVRGAGTSEASGKQLASDAAKSAAMSSLSSMAVPELAMPLARSAARAAAPAVRNSARTAAQSFHATPIENMPQIARNGLDVAEAQKNFPLKKNAGRTYFTDSPEGVAKWNQTIRDATGAEAAPVLRTSAPVQKVPGANESVLIRDQSTPANQLQVFDPATKDWASPSKVDFTKKYLPEQYIPPADKLGPAPTGRRAAIADKLDAFGNANSPSFTQQALAKLKDRFPPPPAGPNAELATAGATATPMPRPELGGAQINRMVPPRPPPRPNTADLHDIVPSSGSLAEEEKFAQRAIDGRASYPPVDSTKALPKNPAWKHRNGVPDEEVDALEQRLRQTEASGQKRIEAGIQNRNNPPAATVRPGKRGKAQAR